MVISYMETVVCRHRYIYLKPKNQIKPNRKIKFGSGLDYVNYTSGSYISRTKKPEPNQGLNGYSDFCNIVYILNINYI